MSTRRPSAAESLPTIVDRLVRQLSLVRIILFGSRARGDARPDSDIDLLVVLRNVENKHRAHVAMLWALGRGATSFVDLPNSTRYRIIDPDEVCA